MISPYLFVGVGGSGAKTLRALKKELKQFLRDAGWDLGKYGFPEVWQFLSIDTPTHQSKENFPAELLSPAEYLGLAGSGQSLDNLLVAIESKFSAADAIVREEIMAALPRKGSHSGQVDEGAGQSRAIGRTVAVANYAAIKSAVEQSLKNMQGATQVEQKAELARIFGDSQSPEFKPTIFLISSLAGGSGSGQFLDVSEAIKAAAPGQSWAGEQIAVLFAPDVFDDPKISESAGIAPNSLAAVGELVASKWRKSPSEANAHLYQANTFANFVRHANYNVGPSDIFLVGKSAGDVVFGSQNEVYLAAATSLAHWVTDENLAKNFKIFLKNNQQPVTDPVGLFVDSYLPMPMNSLGFTRVTLGTERFRDHAIGRLSREVIDGLVFGHNLAAEIDPKLVTTEQKTQYLVEQNFDAFKQQLNLTFESLLSAIEPNESKWRNDFSTKINELLNRNPDRMKGIEWIDTIRGSYFQLEKIQKQDWLAQREVRTLQWSVSVQSRIQQVVGRYAAEFGLKTAQALIKQFVEAAALALSKQKLPNTPDPSESARSALSMHSNSVLEKGNSAVVQALSDTLSASRMSLKLADQRVVVELMADLINNFLTPLASELGSAYERYLGEIRLGDDAVSGNLYKTWPNEKAAVKPPAQNIKMLLPHTEFNETLDRLIGEDSGHLSQRKKAWRSAINELVSGSLAIQGLEHIDKEHSSYWDPFGELSCSWVPLNLKVSPIPSKWKGQLPLDLAGWEIFSERFVDIQGRKLGTLVNENLYEWLNPKNDEEKKARREAQFLGAFTAAINMCKPFAKLNQGLLSQIYGINSGNNTIATSVIPVDPNTSLHEGLRGVLATRGVTGDELTGIFIGEAFSGRSVDFFSTLAKPVHHFVFDNLMQPVIERWNANKVSSNTRGAFMKLRRARLLPEAIPMAPAKLEQLLRGWYCAILLGHLKVELTANTERTPKISVFQSDPSRPGWEALPFPLFNNGANFPAIDFVALTAYSVNIALMDCANEGSLAPFSPYQSLLGLGGYVSEENIERDGHMASPIAISPLLADWIETGTPASLCPTPPNELAGDASLSVAQRQAKVREYFVGKKEEFLREHVDLPIGKPHTTLSWQIRREVLSALDTLILGVDNYMPLTTGY